MGQPTGADRVRKGATEQDTRARPVLLYECYRTGVTLEPEGTVNFTVLFDCTVATRAQQCDAIKWTAEGGHPGSYQKSTMAYSYDEASDSVVVSSQGVSELFKLPIGPYNGLAYYFAITITTEDDHEVYKLYDAESGCGNAAELLNQLDLDGRGEFVFSRDVAQPTKSCRRSLMCA
ncbi:uncharacterized protein [Dermacentor albipictus]|uniref:uncharacterized protein isoform X2 n=1 Tax=Dermacentor albipictus TaxID=60249 RepID=UPI0038FC2A4B